MGETNKKNLLENYCQDLKLRFEILNIISNQSQDEVCFL